MKPVVKVEDEKPRVKVEDVKPAVSASVPAIGTWKELLFASKFAVSHLHPKLGAGRTAVLKEACCVRAGEDRDKVEQLREEGDHGPLRLWPQYGTPFEGIVVTVPLLEWCVRRKYKPDAKTFQATARGGDWDAVRWLRKNGCPWDGVISYVRYNACAGAAHGGHLDVLSVAQRLGVFLRWRVPFSSR